MKKIILQHVVLLFVSLLLLTSCLGEGRNVNSGTTFGIVRTDLKSGRVLLDISEVESIYNSRFGYAYDDDCYLVSFEIDFDLPENSYANYETNGYYFVSLLADPIKVPKGGVNSYLAKDTSKVMTNEVAIYSPTWDGSFSYLKGKMFLISTVQNYTDKQMNWYLSYDMDNAQQDIYGERYYNLFLRATLIPDSSTDEKKGFYNVFEMEEFLEDVAKTEKEIGGSSFKLRFNYPSKIEDGIITWESQNSTNPIYVQDILPEK